MDEAIPFWEKAYRSDDIMSFSTEPNITVKEFEHLIHKQSGILDVGCGEGQNVLYLAKRGFNNIDAFDVSQAGIAKLKKLCLLHNADINAFVCDLAAFEFEKKYDMIMSFATLCFVEKDVWKHFIQNAKNNTNADGIHIMHIFTDTVPASDDIKPFAVGLAHDGEIKELYDDWEILHFQSYVFEDEHPSVPRHLHSVNKIVAKRSV